MKPDKYVSVDDLQAQTTLLEAAAKCGVSLELAGHTQQVRLDCCFGCRGDHVGKREISCDTGNPQKVFACHAYGCQVRGNLLTLMHGWLSGSLPTGGKLKGDEFKRVREVLARDAGPVATPEPSGESSTPKKPEPRNLPLAASDNEKVRELVTLNEKLIRDVAAMPPAAASYVRRHACLTPEAMAKWQVGVMPLDGGGDKRGWSLRGSVVYPILSEEGQVLAWISRDPLFEAKEQAFNALPPDQRAKEKRPAKHRVPADFQRGLELFGQHATRLQEPGYRDAVVCHGIVVVEGFNDVIGLDSLGVPAVAILSNTITDAQASKVERFARQLARGKVTLMFDADEAGDAGAKETLWLLTQRGLDVRLAWSKSMHGGKFAGRQPETIVAEEWAQLVT